MGQATRIYAEWMLDGETNAPVQDVLLTVQGEVITAIQIGAQPNQADEAFSGCTLLPGLIDAHVHLCFSAASTHAEVVSRLISESEEELLRRALANAQQALSWGITTLRDCGGPGRVPFLVRERIRSGQCAGPDVVVCGPPITTPRGHLHYISAQAVTATEVENQAKDLLEQGADFIKVIVTGGNMTPESDRLGCQFDVAEIRTAVRCAEQAGRYVAGHVLNREGLRRAILAGVKTLEHCSWRIGAQEHAFDPRLAKWMREQGQVASLTMSAPTWRKVVPEVAGIDPHLFADLDDRFASERAMLDSGVDFILHTDAGVRQTPFGVSLIYGLRSAQLELGLSPLDCLRAVTSRAAAALGLTDRGRIRIGQRADLLVVAGQPWHDLAALHDVRAVWCAGRRCR
jgi:imidazolonepropionase-like amidohydrolase